MSTAGPGPREAAGFAVCGHENDYYLFTCDDAWNVMFDTWHQTPEEAKRQAEYKHPGISSHWVHPKTKGKGQ